MVVGHRWKGIRFRIEDGSDLKRRGIDASGSNVDPVMPSERGEPDQPSQLIGVSGLRHRKSGDPKRCLIGKEVEPLKTGLLFSPQNRNAFGNQGFSTTQMNDGIEVKRNSQTGPPIGDHLDESLTVGFGARPAAIIDPEPHAPMIRFRTPPGKIDLLVSLADQIRQPELNAAGPR